MGLDPAELEARARRVTLVLLDVDGVLTDGSVWIGADGAEAKQFSIRDGTGIVLAQREGVSVGLVSGRPSAATTRRAAELGIGLVVQGANDKRKVVDEILAVRELEVADVAYMGDDLVDLPVLRRVGLAAAPADAVDEVRSRADWVSRFRGGHGAVREFLEVVLRARQRWPAIVARAEE
jgi:3-deoxy-D-manno-octulosonate 8-phosphate phosphatase (KDO 8-P phosphatase)